MEVTRINEFQASEGKSGDLHDFLKSLLPYINSSQGCISCEVLQNNDDSSIFAVIEKWESIEDHKKSIEGFPAEDMQSAMSLFSSPPKGTYYKT